MLRLSPKVSEKPVTRRVLLVEDDVLLARPLLRLLHRAGYDVVHAQTCAEALLAGGTFDLAVLDLELPDGRGTDLHTELLRLGTVPAAVFFTGARPPLLRRAERLTRCVEKSEGIDALLDAMAATLGELALPVAAGASEMAPASPARDTAPRSEPRRQK